jgi:hypothetical protein
MLLGEQQALVPCGDGCVRAVREVWCEFAYTREYAYTGMQGLSAVWLFQVRTQPCS